MPKKNGRRTEPPPAISAGDRPPSAPFGLFFGLRGWGRVHNRLRCGHQWNRLCGGFGGRRNRRFICGFGQHGLDRDRNGFFHGNRQFGFRFDGCLDDYCDGFRDQLRRELQFRDRLWRELRCHTRNGFGRADDCGRNGRRLIGSVLFGLGAARS